MSQLPSPQTVVSRRAVLKRGAVASAISIAGLSASSGAAAAQRCEIVVPDDYGTIQDAVNGANNGDTICIRQGTYDEDVTVNKAVTLRGRNSPNGNNPAALDGQIEITQDGEGASVRRLHISPSETFLGGSFPDPAGVLVKASDVVIENTVIEDFNADLSNGEGSFTLHGVQVFGAGVSDVTVRNNVIRGFKSDGDATTWPNYGGIAGVKAQAGVENVTVEENEITDHHSIGWVWGIVLTSSGSASGVPTDITVEKNHISGLNDSSVYDVFASANDGRDAAPYPGSAFGIDDHADASEATVRQNNLLAPNGVESKDGDGTLVAECNWWDDRSGPTHDDNPDGEGIWALERGSATVDYTPWLIAPAPSNACVGGKGGGNGNGAGNSANQ
ncbi:right-handed parallel beta-helix repeat-containing protein [Halobellus litoreus]|uniref:Right-handed parallel beta-helix repeat-containing protein n=1 Tax=Halobellus litoreus TaxID=755310 RepID=A0ABD6DZ50_9EURY|nr:right-handed parallel beta-helix repeat-containing protein [Halobellus litoreus]